MNTPDSTILIHMVVSAINLKKNVPTHTYEEINCVVQLDETAELKGMQGWQGAGWTSPGESATSSIRILLTIQVLAHTTILKFARAH